MPKKTEVPESASPYYYSVQVHINSPTTDEDGNHSFEKLVHDYMMFDKQPSVEDIVSSMRANCKNDLSFDLNSKRVSSISDEVKHVEYWLKVHGVPKIPDEDSWHPGTGGVVDRVFTQGQANVTEDGGKSIGFYTIFVSVRRCVRVKQQRSKK